MAPFLRKVTTTSGATAVHIVEKQVRKNVVLEHIGSAHTDAELATLIHTAQTKLNPVNRYLIWPNTRIAGRNARSCKHLQQTSCSASSSPRTTP